ncbi:putative polysaccharide biosynthesis protein [Paenibacillus andongensis]|uniref:putative polysaccharide biosynthesis protein n=1 Tax=Paenibacillus andongensis TaxID=2975482 RepID=UPI0021BBA2ED|nr:polysaccharide biosynthesis protein [Paenibacillus andongensis]
MKKDTLITGTIILTFAAFIARFLGIVQRVPLKHLLGDTGLGTYSIAYNLYFILFTIATAGLPSAVSKIVSGKIENGKFAEANRFFQAAIWFSLISGFIMMIFLFYWAPTQASLSRDDNAVGAIRAIAPSLLILPCVAIIRGYFQGQHMMLPNGLSQVIEQVIRVTSAILLAYWFIRIGWGQAWGVVGASLGGVLGTLGALVVMVYFLKRIRKNFTIDVEEQKNAKSIRFRELYKDLIQISFPIVIFSITVPTINYIDTTIVKPLIHGSIGDLEAQVILGYLGGRAQSIAGLPIILAISISQSIIPIISSHFAKKNLVEVRVQAERALQLSILMGLPVVLVIITQINLLNILIFGDTGGSNIIIILTATSIFQVFMQTSGAVLMGIGSMRPLVTQVIIGISVKLLLSYTMSPIFGIYAILFATTFTFIIMSILNYQSLKRQVPKLTVFTWRKWVNLFFITCIMLIVGIMTQFIFSKMLGQLQFTLLFIVIQISIASTVLFLIYLSLVSKLKLINKIDIKKYPTFMQYILRRLHYLF